MEEYALLGGGGFAIELFDHMEHENHRVVGYYDLKENEFLSKYLPYLGDEHKSSLNKNLYYMIASGYVAIRRKIINFIETNDLKVGNFISKNAFVSRLSTYGKGIVTMPGASISGNVKVGNYLLMNGGGIGHDGVVGNNVVISANVILGGHACVGDDVMFGLNSALLPYSKVGSGTTISAGTVPRKRIADRKLVVGQFGREFDE